MSVQTNLCLRGSVLLMALVVFFPVSSYAGVASVDFSVGGVTAVNAVGVQRQLAKGAEISSGDTISTGEKGRVQVRFSDGALVSLQPRTEFRIDEYQYSGKVNGEEKGFFSLLKGGLRTITGLVGRVNRDRYKVTTGVATIGIRGTEFAAALNESVSELVVNTGEGLVEVCNAAGCMLLASGESGIVSGARAPSRTDSRPLLPPTQFDESVMPVFSTGEARADSGAVMPVSAPLQSGPGYYVAWSGVRGGAPMTAVIHDATAVFDSASLLTSFKGTTDTYDSTLIKGGFTSGGVIGWGAWSSGVYNTSTPLKDMHYVVGTPTPAGDLAALGGTMATYTYALSGFTTPTTSTGLAGGAPSALFTANFHTASLSLDLTVPVNGNSYHSMLSGSYTGASISMTGSGGYVEAKGLFSGSGASQVGVTYKMQSGMIGGPSVGDIMGALVFNKQ